MAQNFISDEDIQKVREAADILSVVGERTPLKQKGKDYWCCCPIHQEKTPSCKIDPHLQLWHCFGCGEGGDIFGFLMKADGMTFPDAVRTLAERYHVDITETNNISREDSSIKVRLKEVCKEAANFYHVQLMRSSSQDAQSARDYLSQRHLGGPIPNKWDLGFAPGNGKLVAHLRSKKFTNEEMIKANVAYESNGKIRDRFYQRIMFPIRNEQGETIAFGGRIIGKGEPKYLNSQETPLFHKSSIVYGLDFAKKSIVETGVVLIVEGYTDVIALHEAGITNVVATLGTALTRQHIRLLSKYAKSRIVYLFDGDEAGQRAASRALEFLDDSMTPEAGKNKVDICAVTLPDNLDPADYLEKYDSSTLQKIIDDAQPLIQYGITRILSRYDLTKAEGRSKGFSEALSILAPIKSSLLAKDYALQIAAQCRVSEMEAYKQLSELKSTHYESQETSNNDAPTVHLIEESSMRIGFENEILGLSAQHGEKCPFALSELLSILWQSSMREEMAKDIVFLHETKGITGASMVSELLNKYPRCVDILTISTITENIPQRFIFLQEELKIGDLEEEIAQLQQQLNSTQSQNDIDALYTSITALQKDVNAIKAHHKLL